MKNAMQTTSTNRAGKTVIVKPYRKSVAKKAAPIVRKTLELPALDVITTRVL